MMPHVWLSPAAAMLLAAGPASAAPATHTVVIEGMAFKPAALTVKAGDTIVWENRDLVPHTVSAAPQRLESGSIETNKSWRYRVAKPGAIDYVCRFHPMMRGRIIVGK